MSNGFIAPGGILEVPFVKVGDASFYKIPGAFIFPLVNPPRISLRGEGDL